MGVLSCVSAGPGGKPFETFGKDSILLRRRKHGTTDRLALPHQSNWNVRLVRPSVQLPAGIERKPETMIIMFIGAVQPMWVRMVDQSVSYSPTLTMTR